MIWLILGVALWAVAHYFKRLFPAQRTTLGDKGKGLIALAILASVVLMVVGYRGADTVDVWQPPAMMRHINNLLMLLAFYVYGASAAKGAKVWLGTKIRHPQLTAVKIWAVAHLLVNGDLASIVLFGGLLAWAVGSVIMINRAEGPWVRPAQAPAKKEVVLVAISLVMFGIVAAIHIWLGVNPFGA